MRTDLLVILALQETGSWNTEDLRVPESMVYGNKFGLTTLLISEQVSCVRRSWSSEERCVAELLGRTLVMGVDAPDSGNNIDWTRKGNDGICIPNSEMPRNTRRDSRKDAGRFWFLEMKRSGMELFLKHLKENVILQPLKWWNNLKIQVTQYSRLLEL